ATSPSRRGSNQAASSSSWTRRNRPGDCTALGQELTVERADIVDEAPQLEPTDHRNSCRPADLFPQRWRFCETEHRVRQLIRAAKWDERAESRPSENVANAAYIGTYGRDARGHRFDECHRRPFVPRGEDEDVGRRVDTVEVAAPAEESDSRTEAQRPRLRLE